MSTTLIIGASGQIGKMMTRTFIQSGNSVRALVRDKSKLADLESELLEIVEIDLEEDFSRAFEGVDNVIFAAGSGGQTGLDKTLLIDLWAAKKSVDYAKEANVKHFVMISSIGADDPDKLPSKIKPYLVAKHMADEHLIQAGIPYTILRPGSLTNEKGTGKITIKRPQAREEMAISREDVATCALFVLGKEQLKGKTFELFNGTYEFDNILV
ncbi:SDR family oxidoreductase [Marinomonas sp. TI.3.20]|uniref:SDR family oxidoreductase n=1 Tax=Marinomonas sp. TI.3.20 TaxID=3121296 RepID=UPI00311DE7B6